MGLIDSNPALGRAKFLKKVERKNRDHLAEGDLPEFMNKLKAFEGKRAIQIMVWLLALTFVRPGELRAAKWQEIDLDKRLWSIKADRMKMKRDHLVPLSDQAIELLKELKEITGGTEFLFPGANFKKPISDVGLIKNVKKLSNGKATPHGFRHTASTILHERGFTSDHIEMQLSHYDDTTRGVYNKAQYLEQRREMMQWWANRLDEAGGKKIPNNKIIELKNARK